MTDQSLTHLAFIVDRSGSMHSIAGDMNGAIRALLADQAALDGGVLVDITTFDDKIEHPFIGVRPDDVKTDVIQPRGSTALNDAIGKTVTELGERLAARDEEDRPGKVIVIIVTDGFENASREWTAPAIKELVERQTSEWSWEFLFLGANIDSFAAGASYGIAGTHTLNYAANRDGTQSVVSAASSYMTRSRAGDTTGFTSEEREATGA